MTANYCQVRCYATFDIFLRCLCSRILGKLDTRQGGCFVPYRGEERKQKYYDVAVGYGVWLLFRGGSFPVEAFQGGITRSGEILYVCRARIDGHLISGKLHPSLGGCYIANASREHKVNLYEVLVY